MVCEHIFSLHLRHGIQIEVWKYNIDIGTETRGKYQPDFRSVSMALSMDVSTDKRAAVGTYHINDFVGITTKDFKDIGAVIKSEHWGRSNWNTSKYTKKDKDPDKSYDVFNGKVNDGETMVSLSESKGVMVKQANEVLASASFLTVDKDNKTKRYDYDNTSEDSKKATTSVLKKGDEATMHIVVRNNTTSVVDHVSLYVPLLNDGLDLGQSFMPEGGNELPMQLKSVKASSNYTIEYLKVREGKSYNLNEAPADSDCEVVSDVSEANMIRFVSKKALSVGDGGTIDVTFTIADDLPYSYNGKRDVITPVLDYDINGNKSTLTKEPAAITYKADKPDPTTSTTTEPTTESTTSTRPSETETTGTESLSTETAAVPTVTAGPTVTVPTISTEVRSSDMPTTDTETAATTANVTAETVRNSGKIVKTRDENNINKFILVAIIAGGAMLTGLIAVTKKKKM